MKDLCKTGENGNEERKEVHTKENQVESVEEELNSPEEQNKTSSSNNE